MIKKLKKFFSKGDSDFSMHLPKEEKTSFILKLDDLVVGKLSCENGTWNFQYSSEFKEKSEKYKPIVGFPDLDKVYKSDTLWPFFRIRIPGLKQPLIKEILQQENIDVRNEVALLKRFGERTIANPYWLKLVH